MMALRFMKPSPFLKFSRWRKSIQIRASSSRRRSIRPALASYSSTGQQYACTALRSDECVSQLNAQEEDRTGTNIFERLGCHRQVSGDESGVSTDLGKTRNARETRGKVHHSRPSRSAGMVRTSVAHARTGAHPDRRCRHCQGTQRINLNNETKKVVF